MAKDKDVKPKWIPCQLMNPIKLSSLTTMRMKFRLLVCRGFIGVEDLFSKEPTNPKNNFFFGLHNGQFHSFFNVILPGLLSSVHWSLLYIDLNGGFYYMLYYYFIGIRLAMNSKLVLNLINTRHIYDQNCHLNIMTKVHSGFFKNHTSTWENPRQVQENMYINPYSYLFSAGYCTW